MTFSFFILKLKIDFFHRIYFDHGFSPIFFSRTFLFPHLFNSMPSFSLSLEDKQANSRTYKPEQNKLNKETVKRTSNNSKKKGKTQDTYTHKSHMHTQKTQINTKLKTIICKPRNSQVKGNAQTKPVRQKKKNLQIPLSLF